MPSICLLPLASEYIWIMMAYICYADFFSRFLPSWMVTDEGPMNLTMWAGPWLAIDSLPGFCQMIRIACMYNSLAKTHDQSTFCLINQMTVHVCHKEQYFSKIYFILTIKLHRSTNEQLLTYNRLCSLLPPPFSSVF